MEGEKMTQAHVSNSKFMGQYLSRGHQNALIIRSSSKNDETKLNINQVLQTKKRCLRCNTLYLDRDNSPNACSFHGHTTGEKGLYALAPPHQGIDGEWSDRSGVIVYKWNDKNNRPNTGSDNWKKKMELLF
ncbi:hypothetical protein OIU79_013968 [Salix purpurea]|uniref:Uncharacterized protein n=1 Tax=Salix purpurea TaxID=77065 RepID=A0A9Q0SWB3_SALPP|nr:hypothetical protein OIU79_013968 [Salix purpurea]